MPASYERCVCEIEASGKSRQKASKACSIAFWQATGCTPAAADAEGRDYEGDLTPLAQGMGATLSAVADAQVIQLDLPEPVSEDLTHFADLTVHPLEGKVPSVLREVRVITPGTYKGHTWTLADLQEIEAAFDPTQPPPVLVQHEEKAGARCGYVRGLRLREDGWLWALAEFIGTHASEQVLGKVWDQTSAGLLIAPYQALEELSVVHKGAVTGSAIQNKLEVLTMPVPPTPGQGAQAAAAAPTTPAPEAQTQAPHNNLAAVVQQVATALGAQAPAAGPPTIDEQLSESKILADMRAENAALKAAMDESQRLVRLKEDALAINELVRCARSVPDPEVETKEIAFITTLSTDQRTAYLELRNALPPVWPKGRAATADMTRPLGDAGSADDRHYKLMKGLDPDAPAPPAAPASTPGSAKLTGATR